MIYQLLAEATLVAHVAFIVFVAVGGLALVRWPRLVWLHLPCVLWAVWVNAAGRVCPLTPLENAFRRAAGGTGYEGGFLEHYLRAFVYSQDAIGVSGLAVGAAVVACNAAVYAWVLSRRRRTPG